MNWYKYSAFGDPPNARLSPDGKLLEIYDSFTIKDKLKSIPGNGGRSLFWWNGNAPGKPWVASAEAIRRNPSLIKVIENFGVKISHLFGAGISSVSAPVKMLPSVKSVSTDAQATQKHISEWVLGKIINILGEDTGIPVVLAQVSTPVGPLGWIWQKRDGEVGIIKSTKTLSEHIELLPDDKNPLISSSQESLFEKFDELFAIDSEEQEEDVTEEPSEENVKGRIPPEKISKYQKDIETTFTGTPKNITISALAGTGKTSMLKHLASFKKPGEKWLYLVFGKQNQREAAKEFPPGIEIYTSHSFLGSKVLVPSADAGIIRRTQLDSQKLKRLIDDYVTEDMFPRNILFSAKIAIGKICALAKNNAIDPMSSSSIDDMSELVSKYSIDMSAFLPENTADGNNYVGEVINASIEILKYSLPGNAPSSEYEGIRDHDDTLWYSALNNKLVWPSYNVVLVDEVQDFNRCQTIMLQKLKERGARIVAVGDVNQSIFLFRGSDADAFYNVQKVVSDAKQGSVEHVIPVNYRCGKAIIKYVNEHTHVKNLEAGRDVEGEVKEGQPYVAAMDEISKEWSDNGNRLARQTALIGRTNKPLIDSALMLLRNGVDFKIVGKDLSKELIDLVKKVTFDSAYRSGIRGVAMKRHNIDIASFVQEMSDYLSYLHKKWSGKASKHDELQEAELTADSIGHVIGLLAEREYADPILKMKVIDTNSFIEYLRLKFGGADEDSFEEENKGKDPKSFVTLTSAHRSKGLEFERVYIIDRDNFPSPKAESEEELKQEANILYVALTRARDILNVLQPPPKQD